MINAGTSSILIIDDDDVFRIRLARAFRDRGMKVGEAATGSDALFYIQQHQPGKIVLDLKLKSESGLDVLRELSNQESSARIVLLTGYGTISTAVAALKLGAINYLTKPVDADTILAAFDGTSEMRRSSTEAPNLSQIEWEHIQKVLQDCEGNISRASKVLGLHRRSLQRKLSKIPQKLR